LKATLNFRLLLLIATASGLLGWTPSPSHALDRAASEEGFGISISGYSTSISGDYSQTLAGQVGASLSLDTHASWLNPHARLFASVGMQNYDVLRDTRLTLSTFDGFAGIRLGSEPFFWVLEPTLGLGVGATAGTLQISGSTSESPNSALWLSTLVSPGVSLRIGAGLSAGLELPIRIVFSTDRLTTWSSALTLRYAL
jgi:hypothetical protein